MAQRVARLYSQRCQDRNNKGRKPETLKGCYRSQRDVDKGRGRTSTQISWFGHEKQATIQNKRFKKILKWSKIEKQKWVLKEGSRSEMEKQANTGKSANSKASCSNSDLPLSSSFLVGLGTSKSAEFGSERIKKDAINCVKILETVENRSVVVCNPMN